MIVWYNGCVEKRKIRLENWIMQGCIMIQTYGSSAVDIEACTWKRKKDLLPGGDYGDFQIKSLIHS